MMKMKLIVIVICMMSLVSVVLSSCGDGSIETSPLIIEDTDNMNSDNSEVPEINNSGNVPQILATPENLNVSVSGRLLTITWDTVPNADGYIVHTASSGCGSGNRIVNTATKTATNHTGEETNHAVAEQGITTSGNGFVTFTSETSFTILLMAEGSDSQQENIPMATTLTAKVMAIGDDIDYIDSEYSENTILEKADYLPAS